MNWCTTCGAKYEGPVHNCGWVTITKDRLREFEDAERKLAALPSPPGEDAQ